MTTRARARVWLRWVAIGLAIALAGLLLRKLDALAWIAAFAEAARSAGPPGVLAVFLATTAGMLLLLPMIPLVLACGWIYGMPGALLSLPAATLAAAVAFLAGRAWGKRHMQQALQKRPKARALAELAERSGLFTVALLRVSPILPFTPSNAVLGMTHLRFRDLILGTFFGILPGGLLYTAAGSLLPDTEALRRGEVPRGPFWAMLVLGVIAMAVIGTAAARKLRALAQREHVEDLDELG